ncbi:MAG: hypothetical protein IJZ96_09950 [Lachnospiraceae bacterium]|nr:hypothetical protein [Lachnospiraceae bacterium]
MGLFDFFKKNKHEALQESAEQVNQEPVQKQMQEVAQNTKQEPVDKPVIENFTIDRIDYYYDKALETYCQMKKISPEDATEEQMEKVWLYAGNHIGFFLTWVIKRGFVGEIHKEYDSEAVGKVMSEEISGTQFLIDYCDTKLWSEDLDDSLVPFVKAYYEKGYWSDYCNWVINELGDLPMEFIGTWEDYHSFEHVLDEAYARYNGK